MVPGTRRKTTGLWIMYVVIDYRMKFFSWRWIQRKASSFVIVLFANFPFFCHFLAHHLFANSPFYHIWHYRYCLYVLSNSLIVGMDCVVVLFGISFRSILGRRLDKFGLDKLLWNILIFYLIAKLSFTCSTDRTLFVLNWQRVTYHIISWPMVINIWWTSSRP